ncbi:MAG: tetratricopeptide repeat protein [Bacteroidota bacterium]
MLRILLWLCMFHFLSGVNSGLLAMVDPGDKDFQEAERLRKSRRYEEAISHYNQAIEKDSTEHVFFLQRGKCEFRLEKYDEAKKSFKSVIRFEPEHVPARVWLARSFMKEGDLENAGFYYQQAVEHEKNTMRKVSYKLLYVNILMKEKSYKEALKELNEIEKVDPENPELLFKIAEIYRVESEWEKAEEYYQRVLMTERVKSLSQRKQAPYHYGLGVVYFHLGDSVKAKRAWDKVAFQPYTDWIKQHYPQDDPEYYYKVAISYYLNDEYTTSLSFLDKVLKLDEDYFKAIMLQARIFRRQGKIDESIENYEKAVELVTDEEKKATYLWSIADAYYDVARYEEAYRAMQKCKKEGFTFKGIHYYAMARSTYFMKDYAKTSEILTESVRLSLNPKEKAKHYFLMGLAEKKQGNNDYAIKAFKLARIGPYKLSADAEIYELSQGMSKELIE